VSLPVSSTPACDVTGLPELLAALPNVKVQLLNAFNATESLRGQAGRRLIEQTQVTMDFSHVEGQGGLGKLIAGDRDNGRPPLPAERIVFGSHAPYFPCESAVFKLFESPLGRPELEKVMRGNAERFLKGRTTTMDTPQAFALKGIKAQNAGWSQWGSTMRHDSCGGGSLP